ncbi:hypothetical protein [Dethiothermospora halolimnae]|uniref:hypothetical protein n=1 Tax=Dethiothermospora halolimnae TaxID=3114390 RepID=UPI003CCC32ED
MDNITKVFQEIYINIKELNPIDRPCIIGVNGIDTSGKTEFAKKFKQYLEEKEHNVQIVHIDDFHNPKKVRYSGENQVGNYFNKSFDIKNLVENILVPIKEEGFLHTKLKLLDLGTDEYNIQKEFYIEKNTIVILEGVFIFREEIYPYLDYKIFIDIPLNECKRRAIERDVPLYGDEILEKYDTKYIPTQKYYFKKYPIKKYADVIIDNTNWDKPKIVSDLKEQ